MDLKHLARVAKLCKKHGITYLEMGDTKLQFDHNLTENGNNVTNPPATDIASPPAYSDEDLINWSSELPNLNG